VRTVLRLCESDLETDVYDGADEQQLEHKVVDGFNEELPVRGPLRGLLAIGAELIESLLQVYRNESFVRACLQFCAKLLNTYRSKSDQGRARGSKPYLLSVTVGSQYLRQRSSFSTPQLVLLGPQFLFKQLYDKQNLRASIAFTRGRIDCLHRGK
jgi:hypothetical protein